MAVSNVPSNIGMTYRFYNINQTQEGPTRFYNNGQSFTEFHQICIPGIYYLQLTDSDANAAQYNLIATLDITDVYECNEVFNDAKLIQLGTNVKASINPVNDKDMFKVEITQPGVLSVAVSNVPSNIGMTYRFYNINQTQEGPTRFYNNGQSFTEFHQICIPGIYYLQLTDSDANAAQYNLIVALDITDVYECNEVFNDAKLINCNDSIFASINPINDIDCFKFILTKQDIITANITKVPSNLSINAKLYGPLPSTTILKNVSGNTGQSFSLVSSQLQPGEYIICLTDSKSNATQYKLELGCPTVVSVEDVELNSQIKIYPNPVSQILNIELQPSIVGSVGYEFYNSTGILVSKGYFEKGINKLGIAEYEKGIYFLQLKNENRITSKKVIIE